MTAESSPKYNFEVGVYRPPSEGGSFSLLLRITRNCPWNRCAFCNMYKTEKFEVRSPEEIKRDIDAIAAMCNDLKEISHNLGLNGRITRDTAIELIGKNPELNYHHGFGMVFNWLQSGAKTAFLQDANSPIMKTDQFIDVLQYLRKTFPSHGSLPMPVPKPWDKKNWKSSRLFAKPAWTGCMWVWNPVTMRY